MPNDLNQYQAELVRLRAEADAERLRLEADRADAESQMARAANSARLWAEQVRLFDEQIEMLERLQPGAITGLIASPFESAPDEPEDSSSDANAPQLRGAPAFREILRARPGTKLSHADIAAEFERRGWKVPSTDAIRVGLNRLMKANEVRRERDDEGNFVYWITDGDEGPLDAFLRRAAGGGEEPNTPEGEAHSNI